MDSESLLIALILASQLLEAELIVERWGIDLDQRLEMRVRLNRITVSCNEGNV